MGLKTYISSLFEVKETKKVECAEVWIVSWDARYGSYYRNSKRVAKAFLNEADAYTFAQSLQKAKDLLQYTEYINIDVSKQITD